MEKDTHYLSITCENHIFQHPTYYYWEPLRFMWYESISYEIYDFLRMIYFLLIMKFKYFIFSTI